jgi:hypothetical protein
MRAAQPRSFTPLGQCPKEPRAPETSAQIQNYDAALGVFVFSAFWRRSFRLFRKLEPRLLELVTSTLLLFFPPPDLIDDERRKHRGLTFRAQTARHN